MHYQVVIEPSAEDDLRNIYDYITQNDSKTKAVKFIKKLQAAIHSLSFMPQRCRNSIYINDGKTKDLIYHGYTVCYVIDEKRVHIVAVFRQK